MQAVGQKVAGELLVQGSRIGLILNELKPEKGSANLITLRFAFVARGPGDGDHIFPSLILDDWGREIRSLKLYRWVRENGERFPRAEIFGYEQDGRDTQCFLRELELYARHPCYAFDPQAETITDGRLVNAILLPDAAVSEPQQIIKPDGIRRPLRSARVTWWRIPAQESLPDLSALDMRVDPGY